MEEKKEVKLFREKNLEAAETPESLNDYLKVTSPGVWLVLAAVVTLLIGGVLWGVFGRITTTVNVAVTSGGGQTVCLVPYETIQSALARELVVTVEGKDYSLSPDAEMACMARLWSAPNTTPAPRSARLITSSVRGQVSGVRVSRRI